MSAEAYNNLCPSHSPHAERILEVQKTYRIIERPPFTTRRRIYVKRGCHTIRERCLIYIKVLKDKHRITAEIPLEQAKRVFQDELDIWDRTSLKAYFGTQQDVSRRIIQRTARYQTGTISNKTIELKQNISKREGYLERLGLVKLGKRGKTWFMALVDNETIVPEICRSHTRVYERLEPKDSNDNFSLTPILQERVVANDIETAEKRESVMECERNLLSESNQKLVARILRQSPTCKTPSEEAIEKVEKLVQHGNGSG